MAMAGVAEGGPPGTEMTGISFRDQLWLNSFPLERGLVFDYFALSPFYDRACNNEQLRMRSIHPLDTSHLSKMTGMEYMLHEVQEPNLFVFRKQKRDGPEKVTPISAYYILDGSIYQAPNLHNVIGSRVNRKNLVGLQSFGVSMEASHSSFSVDAAVQATNDEASSSKLSCVKKGYMVDKYVQFFVRRPARRSPIINRGYYARWAAIRKLMLQFLEAGTASSDGISIHPKKQILSLGAGFDTTYFQLQDEGKAPHLFVELDFMEVTSKKAMIIDAYEPLKTKLGSTAIIAKEQGQIHSDHYKLLPADLRDIDSLNIILDQAQLDPSFPTLILAECVLIYLDPGVSRALIQWAGQKFSTSIFAVYEQIHPDDGFGQQMLKNLERRGCPLLGLRDTPSLEAKNRRFADSGWQQSKALDMDVIYNQHIDLQDRKRIERLELFDEFEEWHMLQEHYCISYGINDRLNLFENFGFQQTEENELPRGSHG